MSTAPHKLDYGGLNELSIELVKFFAEKVKDVKSPLKVRAACGEFKKQNEYSGTVQSLYYRWREICQRIYVMNAFNEETKIKLLFGFSVPVDHYYMEKLKLDANVEVDDRDRITKYEKNGGDGLKLEGEHTSRGYQGVISTDYPILQFLAEISEGEVRPMNTTEIVRKYKKSTGDSRHERYLGKRHDSTRKTIYSATNYDKQLRIRMLFLSGASLHDTVLEEIRKDAIVEIDDKQRITVYKANDGSLELEGDHYKAAKGRRVSVELKQRSGDASDDDDDVADDVEMKRGKMSTKRARYDTVSTDSDEDSEWEETNKKRKNKQKKASACSSSPSVPRHSGEEEEEGNFDDVPGESSIQFAAETDDVQRIVPKREHGEMGEMDINYDPVIVPIETKPTEIGGFQENPEINLEPIENQNDQFIDNLAESTSENKLHPTPPVVNNGHEFPTESAAEAAETKNALQVLTFLHNLVLDLDSPILSKFQSKIEKAIEKSWEQNENIPIDNVLLILESSISIASQSTIITVTPSEETMSFRDFLMTFRTLLSYLRSPSIELLRQKLKKMTDESDSQNTRISFRSIRSVLENIIFTMVTPQ